MASANLSTYNRKRNFRATPEPAGKAASTRGAGSFVVQKHAASHLHYDFRLEWDGVLKSWAVPKGPSLDPADKRMAVQVEDHPVSYGDFEGIIPEGQYGAGSVQLWDRGRWFPIGDAAQGFREGKLKFRLEGSKLKGGFTLVRMRQREGERQTAWLLIKEKDSEARSAQEYDVLVERGESVAGSSRRARSAKKAVPPRKTAGSKAADRLALPSLLSPQLATLVSAPPASGEWQYELKLDGYRLLARVDGDDVRCFTRNGNDWSDRVPRLVSAVRALGLPPCWLDGELVALDDEGVPDFQRLQNSFEQHTSAELRYLLFDLLFLDGEDLRGTAQKLRRDRLRSLLVRPGRKPGIVQFSESLEGDPAKLLAASRAAGFEGLVGKRADASYRSGRSRDWIKLKAGLRQEFVIGGYTDPQGSRTGLGSLLLGVHDEEGALRYAGNVGSGFDERTLEMLHSRLSAIETKESPFEGGPKRVGTTRLAVPHWVKPKLVAEVSFAGWTEGNSVRQAVFHGLRDDKPARQIIMERAAAPSAVATTRPAGRSSARGAAAKKSAAKVTAAKQPASKQPAAKPRAAKLPPFKGMPGLRVTHPERVVDAESGTTKGDLIAYYAAVSPLMLPHLKDRPVALLRAPSGVGGSTFFQKHAGEGTLPKVDRLPRALDPEHPPLLVISSKEALLSAAQMNVVELHTWNATRQALEKPDRFILDLDPGENVGWHEVVESAQLVRALLDELKLKSFLKTSGGKGLHVVVPLKPALGWEEVKQFSGDLVLHLAKVLPQRFVAKSGPRNRVGRVFADYLRNGRGATTIAAWAARVRPGMGISVPLEWRELENLKQRPPWSVADPEDRLEIGNRPWKDYERSRQGLAGAMKTLAAIQRPAKGR